MQNWNRRAFLSATGLGALAAALPAQPQAARPNIVYILADDLGWGDLPCYNPLSAVPMPHADRLASQGVRFTDMHSPSAVCTPTRYGILTGRYCWRSSLKSGVLWGYSPNLIEMGRLTVPALLKQAGYRTAGIGKWHLGLGDREKTDYSQPLRPGPVDHGFDEYFGIPASLDMDPYVYIENDRTVEQPTGHTEGRNNPRGVFYRPGPAAPAFKHEEVLPTLTARAVDYIRQRGRRPAEPFFLYFPLTSPHTPWLPSDAVRGRSRAGDYGDFAAQTDDTLGAVMRALDEAGLAGNTLIIFTSDNGADWKIEDKERYAHRANASWKGEKADVWEGGHRVPFLARWPGRIPPGSVQTETACLTDLMATVSAITAQALPENAGEDSFNLLPALTGQANPAAREAVVHHSMAGMFSIRQGDWKLALGLGSGGFTPPQSVEPAPGGPAGQLFNLREDPREEHNLYQKHPEIVDRLSSLLEKYKRDGRSRPR
ncbi:MAG: arylsulfatase [Bryobacterales bacterium]|nr:arylsulfatase [Bryobacterales bacterium]